MTVCEGKPRDDVFNDVMRKDDGLSWVRLVEALERDDGLSWVRLVGALERDDGLEECSCGRACSMLEIP